MTSSVYRVIMTLFVFSVARECSNYTVLGEADRLVSGGHNHKCDFHLSGWYRFNGAAGTQMPEFCVPAYSCGTHAAGWLNGHHPTVEESAVSRQVCFSYHGCCSSSTYTTVRNCSGFYVYQFNRTPNCHYRYCGIQGNGQ